MKEIDDETMRFNYKFKIVFPFLSFFLLLTENCSGSLLVSGFERSITTSKSFSCKMKLHFVWWNENRTITQ